MTVYDLFACSSDDIGRINPLEEPLYHDIVCPKMVFDKRPIRRHTMSLKQCVGRFIEAPQHCAPDCKTFLMIQLRVTHYRANKKG